MINVNVILCIDLNFIFGSGTLIVSLLKNNQDCFFTFYIYTLKAEQDFIKENLQKRLEKLGYCNFKIEFIEFERIKRFDELQKSVNKRELMCVSRLIAVDDCPVAQSDDRLLYLDADMICVKQGIKELYSIELGTKILAANPMYDPNTLKPFNIYRKHYFCAGILLINLKEWKANDIGYKSMQFVIDKHPVLSDQDALNVVCNENVVFLPLKYNFDKAKLEKDTVIYHYAGMKPWSPWGWNQGRSEVINEFRKYAKLFEPDVTKWITFKKDKFALVNFNSFSARYAAKWMSKLFFKKGNLKAALYFYWQHLVIKVRTKGIIGILLLKSNTKA